MATSSAVTAAPFFPFLFADEPSRLARLFYGYIALGEWECAKATVRQLARHNSARARDMLLELITNGPPATKFSKAIPAASFLTWLCYAEYIAQGGKSADVAANVLDQADFETALHACNEVATKEQSKLLERLRELSGFSKGATAASNKGQLKVDLCKKLNSAEQSRLRELLTDAVPTHAARVLAPFVHANMVHIIIAHLLSVEDSAVEAGTGRAIIGNRCNDALRFVPLLSTVNLNAAQSRTVDQLLQKLRECVPAHKLVEALMASDDAQNLLLRLGTIEDAGLEAFSSLGELHSVALVTGKHVFELVMESAIMHIHSGGFKSLDRIAKCFPVLRNLVLAIGVTHYADSFDKQKALFDSLASFESLFEQDPLYRFVESARWRVNMTQFLSSAAPVSIAPDEILRRLRGGAAPHELCKLEQLESRTQRAELLHLLSDSTERVAVRAYFLLWDVWRNSYDASLKAQSDLLFGGDNATILESRPVWLQVCKSVLQMAARRCDDWQTFGRLIRSIRHSLNAHPLEPSDAQGFQLHDLEEYEFRVDLDLGLRRGPAQLLVDAALEARFDLCDRIVAFFGEANIAPEAVAFWRNEAAIARLRDAPSAAESAKLRAEELLDIAFQCKDYESSRQWITAACDAQPAVPFAAVAALICDVYRVPLREIFGLCRKFDWAHLRGQLDAERELRALLAEAKGSNTFRGEIDVDSIDVRKYEALTSDALLERMQALLLVAHPGATRFPLPRFLAVLQRLLRIRRFEDEGKLLEALQLADATFGASDELLLKCARLNVAQSWQYVGRMRDARRACEFALQNVGQYCLADALDALQKCRSVEALSAASTARTRQVQCCAAIASLKGGGVWGGNAERGDWRYWDALVERDGAAVVKQLMDWKQFELAKDVESCYIQNKGGAVVVNIDSDALLHRLEHLSSTGEAEPLVKFIEQLSDPVGTVTSVLNLCRPLEGRFVLWQFLCKRAPDNPTYQRHLLGATALLALPLDDAGPVLAAGAGPSSALMPKGRRALKFDDDDNESGGSAAAAPPLARFQSLRSSLAHLEGHPQCLVETLILNERVAEASLVLTALPQLLDNDLVLSYARKALAIDSIANASATLPQRTAAASADAPDTSSLLWVLTGDDIADMAVRRQHFFAGAPSVNLATALFDLCSNRRWAARACLDVCHQLSSWLSSSLVTQHLLILNLIKQLLFYAKLLFTRQAADTSAVHSQPAGKWIVPDGGGGEGGVAVCQTFLSHVDLLHDLYIEDCGVTCTVEDLADPRRARVLRDKLIESDRMKLAHAVATQCSVESEPVWLAWGLCLLRMGDYDGAKEKILKCCESQERGVGAVAGGSSGGGHHFFDRQAMLEQILSVLQSEREPDSAALREELNDMEDELSAASRAAATAAAQSGTPSAFDAESHVFAESRLSMLTSRPGGASLDTSRYMQCMFYLSRLGTPMRLLRFWLAHGYLEDAVRYVISGGLSESLFISEVLTHCLAYNMMPELFACLPRIDPRGTKKTRYLVQAAKYLNEAHAFDLLLELQVFMADWPRAGLTCVKLFHTESSFAARIEYLRLARNYFSNAIKEQQQARVRRAHSSQSLPTPGCMPRLSGTFLALDSPPVAVASDRPASSALSPPSPIKSVTMSATMAAADDPAVASPLSEAELARYFRKVMLQLSVLEFLEQHPTIAPDEELRKLSMFGSAKERIAERLVVLAPAADLGFRMMQEFRLPQGEIYARAVRELVLAKRKTELAALLKQIKGVIEGDESDLVMLAIVKAFAEGLKDKSAAEKYISKIFSPRAQVQAYRMCGLLKTAYVLSAKSGYVDEVQAIRTAALQSGASTVVQLCNSYLSRGDISQ